MIFVHLVLKADQLTREKIKSGLEQLESDRQPQAQELQNQGNRYFKLREYEISLDYITIELNPTHYAFFKRSQIYWKLNEADYALSDLDTALSIEEDYQNPIELKKLIQEKIAELKKYTMSIYG